MSMGSLPCRYSCYCCSRFYCFLLDDAEEKQATNRFVKLRRDDLKNLAYDVEGILDEFATKSLRMKLFIEYDHYSTRRLRPDRLKQSLMTNLLSPEREIQTLAKTQQIPSFLYLFLIQESHEVMFRYS